MPHVIYDKEGIGLVDFQIEKMPLSRDEKTKLMKAFNSPKGVIGQMKKGKVLRFSRDGAKLLKFIPKDTPLLPKDWQKYAKIIKDDRIREIIQDEVNQIVEKSIEKIGQLKKNIKLVIDLAKTVHATDRQGRHISQGGEKISDDEIKATANKAISKLVKLLIFDRLDINDKVVIYDKNTDLNVVAQLTSINDEMLRIKIITVMIEKNFYNKAHTPVIEV